MTFSTLEWLVTLIRLPWPRCSVPGRARTDQLTRCCFRFSNSFCESLKLMSIHPREPFRASGRTSSYHASLIQLGFDLTELLPASGSAWVMSNFMHRWHSTTYLSNTVSRTGCVFAPGTSARPQNYVTQSDCSQ